LAAGEWIPVCVWPEHAHTTFHSRIHVVRLGDGVVWPEELDLLAREVLRVDVQVAGRTDLVHANGEGALALGYSVAWQREIFDRKQDVRVVRHGLTDLAAIVYFDAGPIVQNVVDDDRASIDSLQEQERDQRATGHLRNEPWTTGAPGRR
jgi:hypothetical protein